MGGDAEEQGSSLVGKLVLDNPVVKWWRDLQVQKSKDGDRPIWDFLSKLSLIPLFASYRKWDEWDKDYIREDFIEAYGHRFYYSNALSDWMAITNEKAANPCSYFEIQQGECMEYYGMRRGRYICKDYYDDFLECRFQFKQKLRTIAMQAKRGERYREYLAGKREWDTVYIKPEVPGAWRDPGPNPRDQFGTKFNTD